MLTFQFDIGTERPSTTRSSRSRPRASRSGMWIKADSSTMGTSPSMTVTGSRDSSNSSSSTRSGCSPCRSRKGETRHLSTATGAPTIDPRGRALRQSSGWLVGPERRESFPEILTAGPRDSTGTPDSPGIPALWTIHGKVPTLINQVEDRAYLVLCHSAKPPGVASGWFVEPAQLAGTFELDQRVGRAVHLVRVVR